MKVIEDNPQWQIYMRIFVDKEVYWLIWKSDDWIKGPYESIEELKRLNKIP